MRAALSLGFGAFVSCLAPTEIEIDVHTNLDCKDIAGTRIVIGTAATDLTTTQCDAGSIGTLVIVPGSHGDDPVDIAVSAGVHVDPSTCANMVYAADSGAGCIVARRSLDFSRHVPLYLPIDLDLDCLDVSCDPGSTCFDSQCVPSTVDCDAGCLPVRSDAGTTATPVQLTVGYGHVCARMSDATIECWGDDGEGQLGSSQAKTASPMPVRVDTIDDAIDVSAGGDTTCAVRKGGAVYCWGANSSGEALADGGATMNVMTPTATSITNATRVSVGTAVSCALLADQSVSCWGARTDGNALAYATVTQNPSSQLSLGASGGALAFGSSLTLFGLDADDELDAPTNTMKYGVTTHALTGSTIKAIGMGYLFGCLVDDTGRVSCWGANQLGQLGYDTMQNPALLTPVSAIPNAIAIAAGDSHACAITTAGALYCWGDNTTGQLGLGDQIMHAPTMVALAHSVDAVAAGLENTCILQGSVATCWGSNDAGALGIGMITDTAQTKPGQPVVF